MNTTKKPLQGQNILNTRPAETAEDLSSLLQAQGAEVLECPMLLFEPPPSWDDCHKFYQQLKPSHWIVFTSTTAVKRLVQHLNEQAQPLKKLKLSSLAAIGASTAAQMHACQLKPSLVPDVSKQENLLLQLLKVLPKKTTIWIPRSLKARSVLENGLKKSGHKVKIIPVYQTIPPKSGLAKAEPAIMKGQINWLTFTSPQAVSNFIDALSSAARHALQTHQPRTACLGSITSEIANLHGLKVTAQPSQQNMPALVKVIVQITEANK